MTSKRFKIFIGVAASLLLPLYFFIDPEKWKIFPKCPFLALTGLYCPGCGSQRAIHDLLHLRIASSLDHNLLVLPSLILLTFHAWQLYGNRGTNGQSQKILFHQPKTPYVLLIFFLCFAVLRNVPIEVLSFLKPD